MADLERSERRQLLFRPPLINMINVIDKVAIMNKARAKYRIEHDIEIKEQAEKSFEQYKNDPLFIAGIMLYWAEGKTAERKAYCLELNNSDPELLKLYCRFLHKYLNIADGRIRARLFLYPDLNENNIKLYWSELLNIPLNQFIKSYIADSRSSVTKNKLQYGTCSVYIASKDLRSIMAVWIERFASLYS